MHPSNCSSVNRSPPDRKYIAQVVYETKHHDREWLMKIMVAKHLIVLQKVKMSMTLTRVYFSLIVY